MKTHTYKGTVCISDSQFKYSYMVGADVNGSQLSNVRLYFPVFSPESYNKYPTYFLNISCFDESQEIPLLLVSFDRSEAIACAPINSGRDMYYECIDFKCNKIIPDTHRLYVSLTPITISGDDIRSDMDYNSGQSALIKNSLDLAVKFEFDGDNVGLTPTLSGVKFNLTNDFLSSLYGQTDYFIQYHIFVANSETIYEAIESDIYNIGQPVKMISIRNDIMTQFSNESNTDTSHDRWIPGLRLMGTIVIYKKISRADSEHVDNGYAIVPTGNTYKINTEGQMSDPENIHVVKFAGLMTDPFPITQELYGQWCYGFNEEINFDENMEIIQPRIINKTITKVHEITSRTDSHYNIVQPAFFRVRDLANIVVHPEVTENICINLDAYKSQCDSFILKIEGTTFNEYARVEAGVIFKIFGNMLPGKIDSGTYYILNQDAELVTTGKFYYER